MRSIREKQAKDNIVNENKLELKRLVENENVATKLARLGLLIFEGDVG